MHKIFAGQGGQGCISLSGDKSISHRLILFSLLHQGCFKVTNLSQGQDVASSLKAFSALGGQYRQLSATRIELTGLNGNFIPKASQIWQL
jgi:3-phosphoshikimate 1-carboxyvinyltransferase